MAKHKKEVEVEEEVGVVPEVSVETSVEAKVVKVHLLTQEFGNGDMNALRDKINEIIKSL